jgi:hypothetical protein
VSLFSSKAKKDTPAIPSKKGLKKTRDMTVIFTSGIDLQSP